MMREIDMVDSIIDITTKVVLCLTIAFFLFTSVGLVFQSGKEAMREEYNECRLYRSVVDCDRALKMIKPLKEQ